MKIMVVGGGGREHAIIKKLKENKNVEKIYVLPGNGGIANDAECVDIGAKDIEKITAFAKDNNIDFAVVAPDDPLVLGAVDELNKIGVPCFGPDKKDEAKEAVKTIMQDKIFGASGNSVVIEEFLEGPEVSVLSFTDGKTIIPMVSSMDHKRALDNDEGLNTGGMGTVAPNPYYTKEIADECMKTIFLPTIEAMNKEGRSFSGCLYFGLMLTANGPRVIEYNCRFGDPETQVELPLLKSDLLDIMLHIADKTLDKAEVEFSSGSACCVVMASNGYPGKYETGKEITMPADKNIYVAGAKLSDGKLLTSGGRVLGVTETAPSLKEAIEKAYETVKSVSFENAYYRHDIGKKALKALEN